MIRAYINATTKAVTRAVIPWSLLNPLKNIEISNPEYRTLLIDSEDVIWSTSGESWSYSGKLFRSTDFENYTEIFTLGQPNRLVGMFELSDGELLLVARVQTTSNLDNCGVFKTTNNRTDKVQVIRPTNQYTTFVPDWGVSVHGAKVVVSEYGQFTTDPATRGSRYLHYSEDSGDTFSTILDLMNAPSGFFPAVDGWELAHIHCCLYDHVWDRIWIGTGDGDNSKLLAWTDDKGVTWNSINLFNYWGDGRNIQLISMAATDDAVICGSDNANGGILKIARTTKESTPVLEYIYSFGTYGITNLTGIMKKYNSQEPLIIPAGRGDHVPVDENERYSSIITYKNGSIKKVWQDEFKSAYPADSLIINRFGDKLIWELENTKYATVPENLYVPCRYIADFSAFKDIEPTNFVAEFNTDTISAELSWADRSGGNATHEIWRSVNDEDSVLIATVEAGISNYSETNCPQNASVVYKIRATEGLLYKSDFVIHTVISTPLVFQVDQMSPDNLTIQQLYVASGKLVNIDFGDGENVDYSGDNTNIVKNYAVPNTYKIVISGDTDSITRLQISSQPKVKGTITSWIIPSESVYFNMALTGVVANVSNWVIPTTCNQFSIGYNSNITGVAPKIIDGFGGMNYNLNSCSLSDFNLLTEFRKYMSIFNVGGQTVAVSTAKIDMLIKQIADYYEINTPLTNCTYTLTGANMGIPTGGNDNIDIVRLKGYYVAAGKVATVNVNT